MPKNVKQLSRGNEAAKQYNKRMISILNEDTDAIFARVSKVLCSDRFIVNFYDKAKKQMVEVQAAAVDKKMKRLKVSLGDTIVIATSGKTYEVVIVLSPKQVQDYISEGRISKNFSTSLEEVECVEFDYHDEKEEKDEDIDINTI
jgi:translation initiation factor IF-1